MSQRTRQINAVEPPGFDPKRRSFLGAVATAAGVTLAPGVILYGIGKASPAKARALDAPASAAVRWGILVDVNRCDSGCDDCVTACVKEHGLRGNGRPTTDAQWIRKVNIRDPQTGNSKSLPMLCQHCENPPCVDVCPTGASFKRADGIVLVDKHTCIGCRYCMMACPYKARSFVHEIRSPMRRAAKARWKAARCVFTVSTPTAYLPVWKPARTRAAGLCYLGI